ncbi:MAG: DUF3105 domain-containing protein [Actinomycetota bacterium]
MTSTRPLSRRLAGRRNLRVPAVLLAVASLALAACGDSGGDAGPAPTLPTECTPIRSPDVLEGSHIPDGEKATYNSTPPSSGKHYARPVQVGGYTEPIPNERQVHNLEHGHVMIQYRGLSDAQIDRLEEVVLDDPKMVLLAPYPDMDPAVAFTSWGKIQTCDAWTEAMPALARYFIDRNRDNAPESVP